MSNRASTRLFRSGSSVHVTIPKPLRTFLTWETGVELMVTVTEDKRLIIETLEQYIDGERAIARREAMRTMDASIR